MHGFTQEVPDVERDTGGDLYALLQPPTQSRDQGPPAEVWRFAGSDTRTVKARYRFDNLRERRGPNPVPYYLRARAFQVRPDGTIWIQAVDGGGNFELTRAAGEQVGYGGFEGRWGDGDGGYIYVSSDSPASRAYAGVLTRWREPTNPATCFGDSEGEPDCYVIRDARIRDFAVHRGFVWVLDDLNGVLWRRPLDGSTGAWEKVLVGLLEPISLWHTMDPDDPGIFVLEHGGWWRVVPGAPGAPPVRRSR